MKLLDDFIRSRELDVSECRARVARIEAGGVRIGVETKSGFVDRTAEELRLAKASLKRAEGQIAVLKRLRMRATCPAYEDWLEYRSPSPPERSAANRR